MTAEQTAAQIIADWQRGKIDADQWRHMCRREWDQDGWDVRFVFKRNTAALILSNDDSCHRIEFPEDWDDFVETCAYNEQDDKLAVCVEAGILESDWP